MRNVYSNTLAVKALNSGTIRPAPPPASPLTPECSATTSATSCSSSPQELSPTAPTPSPWKSPISRAGFAAVNSSRVLGPLPSFAATDDDTVKSFGVLPNKRYVRIVVTATTATTGGVLVATAILGA